MIRFYSLLLGLLLPLALLAQQHGEHDHKHHGSQAESPHKPSKFRSIEPLLPAPNSYRTGTGSPGPDYWQNRADYDIDVTLDESNLTIRGEETITYFNNSPETLYFLWLQLDQNIFAKTSDTYAIANENIDGKVTPEQFEKWMLIQKFDGGVRLLAVTDAEGEKLKYTVNKTMMRVELPQPLESGDSYAFRVKWNHKINNQPELGGRSGMEYFPKDDNYLFEIAQWFPRMCNFNDLNGWQNKQYLGRGEFCLPFGDYDVRITAPADHIVGATGVLTNPEAVLSAEQLARLDRARASYSEPIIISSEAEARARESYKSRETKTWVYRAENVRDFAFASSRKFIWDAMAVRVGDNEILAQSLYPKEGNPLWEKFSTKVVAHTLKSYSKYTVDYPYPVAISVHGPVWGMEYPMICFNGGRPNADGTYDEKTQNAMTSVIMHEVGHNFFPMIINSDEREHAWMDEGFNSFVQFLTEQAWRENYPSRRGFPSKFVPVMKKDPHAQQPIMTNPEYIPELGNIVYGKTATALNILRETVMGRELFDYAFKEYCQRWAFKNPYPGDFFRSMEDASGSDLDWFWRGWFFSTDFVDLSIDKIEWYKLKDEFGLDDRSPEEDSLLSARRAEGYPMKITEVEPNFMEKYIDKLPEAEQDAFNTDLYIYEFTVKNHGGLVMPIIFEFVFVDGTTQTVRIPAHVWKYNDREVHKVFTFAKRLVGARIDPKEETADVNPANNVFPRNEKE